jgi:putative intracellular protease/amidase
MPEVFTALGRDGKTDIWGVIYRPLNFDPARKYPVIESIYAGPQGSFVPKTFSTSAQPLTALGFIVVQIDGMGTNNRSKAFHDVAFKNLGDAGFADRILWHKAVAAKYPYLRHQPGRHLRTSAGAECPGSVLFHPEFIRWPSQTPAARQSHGQSLVERAMDSGRWALTMQLHQTSIMLQAQRQAMLVVGEMDTNVDPASTLQVVNALIKANKKFDLLFVPGGGHGAGGAFGQRMLQDFFVHHLLGVEPPDWNKLEEKKAVHDLSTSNSGGPE